MPLDSCGPEKKWRPRNRKPFLPYRLQSTCGPMAFMPCKPQLGFMLQTYARVCKLFTAALLGIAEAWR